MSVDGMSAYRSILSLEEAGREIVERIWASGRSLTLQHCSNFYHPGGHSPVHMVEFDPFINSQLASRN
jgi:hypothetical protein